MGGLNTGGPSQHSSEVIVTREELVVDIAANHYHQNNRLSVHTFLIRCRVVDCVDEPASA